MYKSGLLLIFSLFTTQILLAQHSGMGTPSMTPKGMVEEVEEPSETHVFEFDHPVLMGCDDAEMTEVEKLTCTVEKMNTFFATYMHYPEKAKKAKVEGGVIVSYIVKTDGSIDEIKVLDDIGKGCGAEAKRLVNLMNTLDYKWVPANENSEIIETKVYAEVPFNIN